MATKFMNIYRNSFIFFLATKISNFIMSIWKTSFARHIFYDDFGHSRQVENSKIVTAIKAMIAKIQNRTVPYVQQSFIYNFFVNILNNLTHYSMRSYASMCIIFSMLGALLSFILKTEQLPLIVYAGIFLFSIFLFCIRQSFAQLYNGSVFAKFIGKYFGISSMKEEEAKTKLIFWAIIGAILAVLSCTLSFTNFIMITFGVIGLIMVLWKLEIGVFATVFLIPILPTKFIMALCIITIISYFIKLFFTGKAKFQFDLTDFFVFLFAMLIVYSVIISYIPSASAFMAFSYILYILFYFVFKNTIRTKKQLFSVISLLVSGGFVVSLFGIFQRVTGRGFTMTDAWIDTDMFTNNQIRIYSTLDNPNVLGEYLLFIIPLALAGIYYFRNYMYKLVSVGILAAAGLAMVLTLSRGAWLGLIVAAILYTLIKDRRLIWLGIVLVLFAPMFVPQSIVERFMSIGDLTDSSSAYRLNILLASLNMIQDFWPIGIGLGTNVFVFIYQKFAFTAVYAPHSHNLFMQIMIELGIWGLILFAVIMVTFLKNFLTNISKVKSSFYTSVSAALCAGMMGYLIQGFTDHVWYNYRVVAFFWVIIGLSTVLNRLMKEEISHANIQKI